jgi:hypothetical protein
LRDCFHGEILSGGNHYFYSDQLEVRKAGLSLLLPA